MQQYLCPTYFLDYQADSVRDFASEHIRKAGGAQEKAVRLFYAVRDLIRYDPYSLTLVETDYKASHVLEQKTAYCIPKSVLLVALARSAGIPAALGFADVRNHLNTEKLQALMGTDLFIYHGYAALYLNDKWVKVSSAFNIQLCKRFGVLPLEFDGEQDALMHPYDAHNRRHMEYVNDRGLFADLPFEEIKEAFQQTYPQFVAASLPRTGSEDNDAQSSSSGSRFEDERPLAS